MMLAGIGSGLWILGQHADPDSKMPRDRPMVAQGFGISILASVARYVDFASADSSYTFRPV